MKTKQKKQIKFKKFEIIKEQKKQIKAGNFITVGCGDGYPPEFIPSECDEVS